MMLPQVEVILGRCPSCNEDLSTSDGSEFIPGKLQSCMRHSSIGTVTEYGLDERSFIFGKDTDFSLLHHRIALGLTQPDTQQQLGTPSSRYSCRGLLLATNLALISRLRLCYLHSSYIRLHNLVLN
jgi:hypothetical protein